MHLKNPAFKLCIQVKFHRFIILKIDFTLTVGEWTVKLENGWESNQIAIKSLGEYSVISIDVVWSTRNIILCDGGSD